MLEEQAPLAAIIAAPDDDRPLQEYADWVEAHGEHDRARLIHVQMELPHKRDNADETSRLQAIERGNRFTADGLQTFRARFGDRLSAAKSLATIEPPGDCQEEPRNATRGQTTRCIDSLQ